MAIVIAVEDPEEFRYSEVLGRPEGLIRESVTKSPVFAFNTPVKKTPSSFWEFLCGNTT